ncbi:hypothetical protein BT63DRAFT_18035 [Microthyrium microscopicum]|uniref:Uncharacterized protein n=1 Tax=Microthyrium microscopicum TaxID=703497 RepID=A0A6A6UUS9_9PEZI|nr:hypothetical protein BT63DRAFT_18035 [Microthyrium microscopicum]
MASQPLHLKMCSLYRQILRELPARPTNRLLSKPTPIHTRIRNSFASAPASQRPDSQEKHIQQRIEEGEQLVAYLKAQRVYTTLLERYNPGMGMDEAERVRLSARRVGMNLPVEFKD